jgi:hypothetical protein
MGSHESLSSQRPAESRDHTTARKLRFTSSIGSLVSPSSSALCTKRRSAVKLLEWLLCKRKSSSRPSQTIAVFDAPGAGTSRGQGTFGIAIHSSGAIAGAYVDANNVWHGFLRAPCGAVTTFDAPGAGAGSGQGTPLGFQPGRKDCRPVH